MIVLSLNAGSSSLKYKRIDTATGAVLDAGVIERIGAPGAPATHEEAFDLIPELDHVDAAGHRVVHGGERFSASVLIDDAVEAAIEALIPLAPLHNPANLEVIRAGRHRLPHVPHVAVFDTAFHAHVPPAAYTYALPYELAQRWQIRRYGFHGTSHRYLASRLPGKRRLITLHLGNGCSAAAILDGHSIDTTMGMTPVEGLVMGTRPGDLDPGLLPRLMEWEGMDGAALDRLLSRESGLLGLSGVSNDMRELEARAAEGHARARLAIDVFCHRIRRAIGSLFAVLNGADALVFAGGIGENSASIRARVCTGLDALGFVIDDDLNHGYHGGEARLSPAGAPAEVWVVPTNEELLVARDAAAVALGARGD
jgi:acetate kinase